MNLDPGHWKSPLLSKNNGRLSPLSFLVCKALGRSELAKGVVVVVAGVVVVVAGVVVVVAGVVVVLTDVVVIMVVGVVILVVVVAGVGVVVCFTVRK